MGSYLRIWVSLREQENVRFSHSHPMYLYRYYKTDKSYY